VCRPGPRRRRGRAQSGSDADRKRECGRAGAGVQAHHALLGDESLILENLTGLGAVGDRFELRAYPLALASDATARRFEPLAS